MPNTGLIALQLFDSTRQPVGANFASLVRITDGRKKTVSHDVIGQPPLFQVAFFNNNNDLYTVNVAAKKYCDAGFHPVKVRRNETVLLDLMLMPSKSKYNFTQAAWPKLKRSHPALVAFIANGLPSDDDAQGLYDELLDGVDRQQDALACLHNITTALKDVLLPRGKGIDYFKRLIWEKKAAPQRDRFFAYADEQLITQILEAKARNQWDKASPRLHPGATRSFKQIQFGEANIQLSFHENDTLTIGETRCVKVEADLDYFKDKGAHFFLEVIPNALSGNRTNPKAAYLLRWIAGRSADVADFNPPYTIEAVTD